MSTYTHRLYVTGRLAVETMNGVLDEARLPSRQARLLFSCLALSHGRDVAHESIAEALWPEGTPDSWDSALKALISKLRHSLREVGLGIETKFGCYRLERAKASWLDWEAAAKAIDEAEGALRAGEPRKAWGPANITVSISKRGFLTGEHGAWVDARRHELDELLIRGLTAYAEVGLETGQCELAVRASKEAIALEPFRELGYQHLMRAQAVLGNRAEALRAYHHCRELLTDELGVGPSQETEAVYLEILKAG